MLEVCGLTKRFNGIPAVEDVSFTLKPGEILGYVGPNGAGKSTTVKMIIGLLEPSEGQVRFQGRSVLDDLTGFQARIGYVPEEPHLYPHLRAASISNWWGGSAGCRGPSWNPRSMNSCASSRSGTTGTASYRPIRRACGRRFSCRQPCCTIPTC